MAVTLQRYDLDKLCDHLLAKSLEAKTRLKHTAIENILYRIIGEAEFLKDQERVGKIQAKAIEVLEINREKAKHGPLEEIEEELDEIQEEETVISKNSEKIKSFPIEEKMGITVFVTVLLRACRNRYLRK